MCIHYDVIDIGRSRVVKVVRSRRQWIPRTFFQSTSTHSIICSFKCNLTKLYDKIKKTKCYYYDSYLYVNTKYTLFIS